MLHRIERLKNLGKTKNIDAFLLTSPSTIKCLSGYFYNFEIGPSPFQILPSALVFVPEEIAVLIIADNESLATPVKGIGILLKPYSSYVHEKPLDYTNQFIIKLQEVLIQNKITDVRIGIEGNSLPYVVAQFLRLNYPNIKLIDVSEGIIKIKTIKDIDETDNIRQAAKLCDIGQAAVMKHARPGISELELFNLVRLEIEASVGTRVPLMADLVSGAGTASGGGIPSNRVIQNGDPVLCDLTPCLNGYWGDSCNTFVVGQSSSVQRKSFALVKEALNIAINSIQPGVKAMEIDRLMRRHIGNFPHHGGHGVGTLYHEEPRIVSYNNMILEPDMVIALEPGIYEKEYGIRLEHLVLVTETGCELLTKFQHCLIQLT